MRENKYYYVDKTSFIKELLQTRFKANLITRPRRFGKSLTMSMLKGLVADTCKKYSFLKDCKFPHFKCVEHQIGQPGFVSILSYFV